MKIYALITTQGTAMPETALCEDHLHLGRQPAIKSAQAADDWDGDESFTDCTGNDLLACFVCGEPEGDVDGLQA